MADRWELDDYDESVPARRSRTDVLSLGAGAIFLGIALTVLVGGGHGLVNNAGWVLPVVLIGFGLLGLAPLRRRSRYR